MSKVLSRIGMGGSGGIKMRPDRLEIVSLPTKTDYKAGESFDPSGMRVELYYDNGAHREVTSYAWSPFGPLEESDKSITIRVADMGVTLTADVLIIVKDLPDKKPLDEMSWADISFVARSGEAANYWNVGDAKFVTMRGSIGTIYMQIIGFDHDDATYPEEYGRKKAGITFQYGVANNSAEDGVYKYDAQMNLTNTNNTGWENSLIRSSTVQEVLFYMPDDLQEVIVSVDKRTSLGEKSPDIGITSDKIWLLSEVEIFGNASSSYEGEGAQYKLYADGSGTKRYLNGSGHAWWTRSPRATNSTYFVFVTNAGVKNTGASDSSRGVSCGFCV